MKPKKNIIISNYMIFRVVQRVILTEEYTDEELEMRDKAEPCTGIKPRVLFLHLLD